MSERMSLIEDQVGGLIDLVLDGQNAEELIDGVYDEIQEGQGGGPFPIGSRVKINKGWSGEGVDGGNVSVSRGDVVSVVMPNLGKQGQDRMVLLADGKTRVVVPFAILGENLEEQNMLKQGPKGHAVSAAKGKLGGTVSGKAQGDHTTPEQTALKPMPGLKKPVGSMPSMYQGKGKPKDASTAQMMGQMAPATISGKTVEQVMDDVLLGLEKLPGDASSSLSEMLIDEEDEIMYAIMHEALYGEEEFTVENLHEFAEMMKDKKKKNKKDDEEGYTEEDIDEIFHVMHATSSAMKKKKKGK